MSDAAQQAEAGGTPAKSVEGGTPAKSVEGVAPAKSVEGVAPAKSVEGVAPAKSVEGVAPAKSVEGVAPAKSVEGVAPAKSVEGVAPAKSVEGVAPARPLEREVATLIGLVVTYLGIVAALAANGKFTFIYKTALIPLLVIFALVMGKLGAFVKDWAVFLSSIILFDCMRGLVYATTLYFDLPIHAVYAVRWDEAIFGGESLPVLLQRKLFDPPVIGPFERMLTVVHSTHFMLFILVGMAVWLFRRDEFWRFRRAITLLMGVGLTIYFLVPTVPPWMAAKLHVITPIRHITAEIYNMIVPTLQTTFDVNPVAAMPSLHTAFPTLCSMIAVRHFGRRAFVLPLYTVVMWFSIAYLGEHYLVDIAAGVLVAAGVYVAIYGLPGRAPKVAPSSYSARFSWVRHATVAIALVGLSELVGQVTMHWRHPLFLGPRFVAREMVGRSDKTHLMLGRHALSRGDRAQARRELTLALDELRLPDDRLRTAALLEHVDDATLPELAPDDAF